MSAVEHFFHGIFSIPKQCYQFKNLKPTATGMKVEQQVTSILLKGGGVVVALIAFVDVVKSCSKAGKFFGALKLITSVAFTVLGIDAVMIGTNIEDLTHGNFTQFKSYCVNFWKSRGDFQETDIRQFCKYTIITQHIAVSFYRETRS